MVKKAKKTPAKPAEQIKVPFGGLLAGLFKFGELSGLDSDGTVAALPSSFRGRLQRRGHAAATGSLARLAASGAHPRSRSSMRGEFRRAMMERERRIGRREAIEQLQRAFELPEAKGHEIAAVEMAIDGVPVGAIRVALKSMSSQGRRGGKASWAERPPLDVRAEVFARAARSAKPTATQRDADRACDPETKAAGDEAADSGASPLPP